MNTDTRPAVWSASLFDEVVDQGDAGCLRLAECRLLSQRHLAVYVLFSRQRCRPADGGAVAGRGG